MTKKQTIVTITAILCLTVLQFTGYAQQKSSSATYKLDIYQSKLFWKMKKAVGGGHNGFILFSSGTLNTLVTGKPTDGMFNLNMNSISTTDLSDPNDNKEVNNAIKAANLFDVSRYPTAIMIVKTITITSDPLKFKVSGDLTMKGVTKTIDFIATIKKNQNTIKATADFKIDRTKWGIIYQSGSYFSNLKDNLIEDDIQISLNLIFNKA